MGDKLSFKYFSVICGINSESSMGLACKIRRSFCKLELRTTYT